MTRPQTEQNDLNQLLYQVHRLQDSRQERDRRGLFFVEGIRNFLHAVEAGYEVQTILHCKKLLKSSAVRQHVQRLNRTGVFKCRLCPEQFRRISRTPHASGIGAILKFRTNTIDQIDPTQRGCWVALSRVRSPGNLGTLIRTSDAVGANGLMLLDDSIDPYDPQIVRASMGGLFRQTFVRTATLELRQWADQKQYRIIAASPDGERNFQHCPFPETTILLLGEERQGLTSEERAICHDTVRIPMTGQADSLNLGVAGSLLLYEVYRSNSD